MLTMRGYRARNAGRNRSGWRTAGAMTIRLMMATVCVESVEARPAAVADRVVIVDPHIAIGFCESLDYSDISSDVGEAWFDAHATTLPLLQWQRTYCVEQSIILAWKLLHLPLSRSDDEEQLKDALRTMQEEWTHIAIDAIAWRAAGSPWGGWANWDMHRNTVADFLLTLFWPAAERVIDFYSVDVSK